MIEGTHQGHSKLFELAIDTFFQISEADVELDMAKAHLVGDFCWVQICNFPSLFLIHLFILSEQCTPLFIIYMKVAPKRDRTKQMCKTQPDQLDQIRVSLGEEAKQRLREISCVNPLGVSRSRDWTLDQYPSFKLSTAESKRQQTASFYDPERKPLNLGLKIKDVDYIRRLNRTQGSMRVKEDEVQRRACNSVTVNFDADPKQQARIHSNGQAQIEFENMTFNISNKTLREAKSKVQTHFGKTRILFHNKDARKIDRTRTPLPYRKLAARTTFQTNEPFSQTQAKPMQTVSLKSEFTLTKEFIDLRALLMEQRRNIFYPVKTILSVKHRAK